MPGRWSRKCVSLPRNSTRVYEPTVRVKVWINIPWLCERRLVIAVVVDWFLNQTKGRFFRLFVGILD